MDNFISWIISSQSMFLALLRDLLKHCDIDDLSEPLYLYVLIYYINLSWNIEASFWSL